jgi:hypothetical protein
MAGWNSMSALHQLPSRIDTTRCTTADSTTSGSWLVRMTVRPSALRLSRMPMNSRESAVSRLAVGSSAMSTFGSFTSARAMATRCCSPPESHSTLGIAPVASLRPSSIPRRAAQLAVRPAGGVGRQDHVVQRGEALDQIELLEDETEALAADLGQEALGQPGDVLAFQAHAALGRPRQAADDGQERGLARAAGAAQRRDFVGLDAQVDAVERPVLVVMALVEGLADGVKFDHLSWPAVQGVRDG